MAASIDNELFRNLLFSWPEKAMKCLYEDHYDKLILIADMHTHDRKTSEDALQEVFADISQRHKELGQQREEPFEAYLIRAIQYHSISLYKKKTKTVALQREYYYYHQSNKTFESPVENKIISAEKQSFFRFIIGTFPKKEKTCLLLQIDHGMSVKEIAKRLNVCEKAVERSLTSGKRRLRRFGQKG